jgi:hypothetical protein
VGVNVALDANVFLQDRWFEKQNMRALADYLTKTPWMLVVSEVVEDEVKACVRRDFKEQAARLTRSLRQARKQRLDLLPEYDADLSLKVSMERWESFLSGLRVERVPIRADVAREAVRRAANRIPPCSTKGEGMRDALIWLSLVCNADEESGRVAFVSGNTGDFAAPDKRTLRPELIVDANVGGSSAVIYYASLDDFLKERAELIGHIIREWILEHLDPGRVGDIVRRYVGSGGDYAAFEVSEPGMREPYTLLGEPEVTHADFDLIDFYVWQFNIEHVEFRMAFRTHVEATIDCARETDLYTATQSFVGGWFYGAADLHTDDEGVQALVCQAELSFDLSARVETDAIRIIGLEQAGI